MSDQVKEKWYLKPVTVILALFVVLGPLGLPLLFKSPCFSKTIKILLAIATIIYTICLIYASIASIRVLLKTIGEMQQLLQ
jgi:hypothetical protein